MIGRPFGPGGRFLVLDLRRNLGLMKNKMRVMQNRKTCNASISVFVCQSGCVFS